MASELEEATEITHELIKEDIINQTDKERSAWINRVALSTMIMALISALGALLAGVTSNQLLIERTEAILEVSHMETDRLNLELLKTKHAILKSLGETLDSGETGMINKYEVHFQQLNTETDADESNVKITIFNHELFAIGVTLLSIAITLCGMSLVTNRKQVWLGGLVFGVVGASVVGVGVYRMIL